MQPKDFGPEIEKPLVERHAGGAPTKYAPDFCKHLLGHMGKGLSFATFSHEVGVNLDTIYDWAERHPEFLEAKKAGEMAQKNYLEKIGIALATGQIEGNVTAWIFIMKNHGWI
ncbi:MAG: hypothetical protein HC883_02090 [Bdellovibrionaceae bacterium]|nr:hypothetical protein [Pseudobdellovibrionaceae bacterium]